jgi:hypothetical protein
MMTKLSPARCQSLQLCAVLFLVLALVISPIMVQVRAMSCLWLLCISRGRVIPAAIRESIIACRLSFALAKEITQTGSSLCSVSIVQLANCVVRGMEDLEASLCSQLTNGREGMSVTVACSRCMSLVKGLNAFAASSCPKTVVFVLTLTPALQVSVEAATVFKCHHDEMHCETEVTS